MYTIVYLRVHNLALSIIPSWAASYVYPVGVVCWYSGDTDRSPLGGRNILREGVACGACVEHTNRIQMSVLMRDGSPLCFLIFYCTFVLSYEYDSFINRMKRILTIRKESQQGKPV